MCLCFSTFVFPTSVLVIFLIGVRLNLHWQAPSLSAPLASFHFVPSVGTSGHSKHSSSVNHLNHLLVLLANNTMLVLDVEKCEVAPAPWRHKGKGVGGIPRAVQAISGPFQGAAFTHNRAGGLAMMVHGQGFMVYVDWSEEAVVPEKPKLVNPSSRLQAVSRWRQQNLFFSDSSGRGHDRGRVGDNRGRGGYSPRAGKRNVDGSDRAAGSKEVADGDSEPNFAIVEMYRSIVHVGAMSHRRLVSLVPSSSLYLLRLLCPLVSISGPFLCPVRDTNMVHTCCGGMNQ